MHNVLVWKNKHSHRLWAELEWLFVQKTSVYALRLSHAGTDWLSVSSLIYDQWLELNSETIDYNLCLPYDSRCKLWLISVELYTSVWSINKKAQLSLTNPRDAKACQKLLQFDVLTMLSLTILAYLHSFSCCCVRNLQNPAKFTENSSLWSSRSSKVIDLGVNRKPICDLLLVINSNFGRIYCRFRDIDA